MSQPLLPELEVQPPTPLPSPSPNSTSNRALPGSQTKPDTAIDELVSGSTEVQTNSSAQMDPSKARTAANPARQSSQNGQSGSTKSSNGVSHGEGTPGSGQPAFREGGGDRMQG